MFESCSNHVQYFRIFFDIFSMCSICFESRLNPGITTLSQRYHNGFTWASNIIQYIINIFAYILHHFALFFHNLWHYMGSKILKGQRGPFAGPSAGQSFGWSVLLPSFCRSVLWLVSPFAILLPVSPLAGQ